jgi:hypothetical protein
MKRPYWMSSGTALAALAALCAVSYRTAGHSRPSVVQAIVITDEVGRRLPGLFFGIGPDPRNDLELIALAQHPESRCGAGVLRRMVGLFETVVYAQSDPCNAGCGLCMGNYWGPLTGTCPGPGNGCSTNQFQTTQRDPTRFPENQGQSPTCQNMCPGCPGENCGYNVCDNGYVPPPPPPGCQNNDQCPWNQYCDMNHQCIDSNCGFMTYCHGNSQCAQDEACQAGCCEPGVGPPPPPPVGCDTSIPDNCSCGRYCYENLWWQCYSCGGGGGDPGGGDECWDDWDCQEGYYCDRGYCEWDEYANGIIFDPGDEGVQLTSASAGVQFDLTSRNQPKQTPWLVPGTRNAFLALDLNRNGRIDNGEELVGKAMPQPGQQKKWNALAALAQFDSPLHGGNGDGVIDNRDKAFSVLRLWTDTNHNGISEPNELATLAQAQVLSITLQRQDLKQTDSSGNRILFRARYRAGAGKNAKNHWFYGVTFGARSKR